MFLMFSFVNFLPIKVHGEDAGCLPGDWQGEVRRKISSMVILNYLFSVMFLVDGFYYGGFEWAKTEEHRVHGRFGVGGTSGPPSPTV